MSDNIGQVVQITGPAVDVQFTEAGLPPIYQALRVVSDGFKVPKEINVILEVQQHLGEGRARCIAMATSRARATTRTVSSASASSAAPTSAAREFSASTGSRRSRPAIASRARGAAAKSGAGDPTLQGSSAMAVRFVSARAPHAWRVCRKVRA